MEPEEGKKGEGNQGRGEAAASIKVRRVRQKMKDSASKKKSQWLFLVCKAFL